MLVVYPSDTLSPSKKIYIINIVPGNTDLVSINDKVLVKETINNLHSQKMRLKYEAQSRC